MMKTMLGAACLLWMMLAIELTWPRALSQGAVLLPVACAVMYWTRSATGILLAGLMLLMDWIARPSPLPLCSMGLPFLAALWLSPSGRSELFQTRSSVFSIPVPLQLPLLTLAAMLLQTAGAIPSASFAVPDQLVAQVGTALQSLAIVALPISAVLSLMIRVADEFGLRRSLTMGH
jgi:hypothetical protein